MYSSVQQEEHDGTFEAYKGRPRGLSMPKHIVRRPLHLLAAVSVTARVSIVLALVMIISLLFRATPHHVWTDDVPSTNSNFFHLIIPATNGGVRFCKTLFSAAVLDYPTPIVINWAGNDEKAKRGDIYGGTHTAKVSGILRYLDSLGSESDQELVLIVDGYDLWFQLPPSVLLDRYQRAIAQANARLRRRLGDAADKADIRQTIIVAAGKICWPQSPDSPTCTLLPESELAPDTYDDPDDNELKDIRARWLNSGFIMGPAVDVRRVMKRAEQVILADQWAFSDQMAFNEIFAQQEYQRELLRMKHLSSVQKLVGRVNKYFGLEDQRSKLIAETNATAIGIDPAVTNQTYEYHLGLDYTGGITHTLDGEYYKLRWLTFSKLEDPAELAKLPHPERVDQHFLEKDIAGSALPFSVIGDNDTALSSQQWNEVPLWTEMYSAVVPATFHMNRPKAPIESEWSRTWFYPHLRKHLRARILAPRTPVAVTTDLHGQRQWWSPVTSKGGVMAETATTPTWLGWDQLCGAENEGWDELFSDKQGKWVDPRAAV
ncbi:hypothetical protein EDD36DRAFT_468115 [Exophiala viscosa]|uniref:Uncharacterized protein n=1 Tax=Exophiala viscosa TaxID=2486360 RepID=A0AAN6IAQ1_9EURO|nr:hypothetical protein EDD36DRAFT_468115 [Exophiala viscosa]